MPFMAAMELLTLNLRSALFYSGFENPPFTGVPSAGTTIVSDGSPHLREARFGSDMAEGEEELFLFDEEDLIAFDPDDGPLLCRPLPRPSFYGRRASDGKTAEQAASLGVGCYLFLQWRPSDEDELLAGLEWFAKEAWWQRVATKGPYILRRLREDGALATQVLRRID